MSDEEEWVSRLQRDGFIERTPDGQLTTTRRWHGVLARAARRLCVEGQELDDLRTPIATALLDSYVDEADAALAVAVRTMLPLAMRELAAGVR
jgi:hypothetical protein